MKKINELILRIPWLTADFVAGLRLLSSVPLIILIVNKFYLPAFIVFTLMALTDMFDGYLARLRKTLREEGVVFDSVVDMVFFLPPFLILGLKFLNPAIVFLLVSLEVLRGILALMAKVLKFSIKLEANCAGKIKACFEGIGLALVLFNPYQLSGFANIILLIAIIFAIANVALHLDNFLKSIKK